MAGLKAHFEPTFDDATGRGGTPKMVLCSIGNCLYGGCGAELGGRQRDFLHDPSKAQQAFFPVGLFRAVYRNPFGPGGMNEIFLIQHNSHMIGASDFEQDQVCRQNLLPGYFITGLLQLFCGYRNLQSNLLVDIMDQPAAVEGIRAFCAAAVRFSQEHHCILDDVFSNLAARFVKGHLLGAASKENGDGQE
jgi:hypothetical protein